MNPHNEILCFFIGLVWAISGAFAILMYIDYDHNRLASEARYKRFLFSLFIFGIASATYIIHEFIS